MDDQAGGEFEMTDWDELWEQVKPEGEPPAVSGELKWALILGCHRCDAPGHELRPQMVYYPEAEREREAEIPIRVLVVDMLCPKGHVWKRRMDRERLHRLVERRCLFCGEHEARMLRSWREPSGFKTLVHCEACGIDDEREVSDAEWCTDE